MQIPPKNSSPWNVLVERDINTSKDEDTEVPQAKKAKNSGETAASSKKTKATGVKQTISAAAKKTKAAVEEEKTNAAAAKKNKSAATKKTKASATAGEKGTKKPEKPEKLKNPKLCVALCLPGNYVLKLLTKSITFSKMCLFCIERRLF